jgi:hypothetical protein
MSKFVVCVVMMIALLGLVGCEGEGSGTSSGSTSLAAPATLPPMQTDRTSFSMADLGMLMTIMDEGTQITVTGCTPHQVNGVAVPEQFVHCTLDTYWNGTYAGPVQAYVQGGKIVVR